MEEGVVHEHEARSAGVDDSGLGQYQQQVGRAPERGHRRPPRSLEYLQEASAGVAVCLERGGCGIGGDCEHRALDWPHDTRAGCGAAFAERDCRFVGADDAQGGEGS